MDSKPSSPTFSEFNNTQLEALLHKPDLSPAQKEQVRRELTRRLRDDLLRNAQNVTDSMHRQKRRRWVWKTSRLALILVVIMLCALSSVCLYVLAPPELLSRLTEFIQPLLNLFPG